MPTEFLLMNVCQIFADFMSYLNIPFVVLIHWYDDNEEVDTFYRHWIICLQPAAADASLLHAFAFSYILANKHGVNSNENEKLSEGSNAIKPQAYTNRVDQIECDAS